MPKKIDPSKLTEEIDGVQQPTQETVTLIRPVDNQPASVPANLAEQLIADKGFKLASPGDFTEMRAENVQKSFEAANAEDIKKSKMISQIVKDAVGTKESSAE